MYVCVCFAVDYADEDSGSVNRASRRPVSMREGNKQQQPPPAPVVQKPAAAKDRRAGTYMYTPPPSTLAVIVYVYTYTIPVAFGGSAVDRNPRDMRIPPKDSNPPPSTAASGKPKKPMPLEKMFPKKADVKKLTGAAIINKSSIHINGHKDSNPIQHNDQVSNHGFVMKVVCIHTYIYTYIYKYIHTYIHIHISNVLHTGMCV